jgi:hypothetical protein
MFINNVELRQLNRKFGDEIYPLDVEWKNCLQGPDAYLNCRKRTEGRRPSTVEPAQNALFKQEW